MMRGSKSTKRSELPGSMAPGFGAVGAGWVLILHEPLSGADIPVLVAELPPMLGRGPHGDQVDVRVAMALSAGMASTFDLRNGPFLAGWSARRSDPRGIEIIAGADVFVTTKGYLPSRWLELAAERQEVVLVCVVGGDHVRACARSGGVSGRAVRHRPDHLAYSDWTETGLSPVGSAAGRICPAGPQLSC